MKALQNHPRRAFSLVEVVLALGVFSVAAVALIGAFSVSFASQRDSTRDTVLAGMSRYVLSDLRPHPFDALWAAQPATVKNPRPKSAPPEDSRYYFREDGTPVTGPDAALNPETLYECVVRKTPDPQTRVAPAGNFNLLRLELVFSWPVTASPAPDQRFRKEVLNATIARY
jgi:uncharacterized protein (TIGR02598 family)